MPTPRLFPTWREEWCKHDAIASLLQEADALLMRRGNGNRKYPVLPDIIIARAEDAAAAMDFWLQGKLPPAEVGPIDQVAALMYQKAWSVLRPSAWPRWLLLEIAFRDSSKTGDLHFAALTLRTMCEEIERQRLLDIDESRFVELAISSLSDEQERFSRILKCARSSIAPLETNALNLPKNGGPDEKLRPNTELDNIRASLNDYVHPNYGSQIAAIYPERDTAARVLLTAVVAAYRAFFALSWSEQPLRNGSRPIPVQDLSMPRAARDVVSRTLPGARELVPELEIPSALDWLTRPLDAAQDILNSPQAIELLDSLPETIKNPDKTIAANVRWAGVTADALLSLALARRSESLITLEFPNGAPPVQETKRWLSFLSRSIELILLINEVKEASFKFQLVRQLAQRNAIGIDLCTRSLIEHRATVMILPRRLAEKWIETAKRFQPGSEVPKSMQELDNAIAKLLAGRRSSVEPLLPFATREDGKPVMVSVSLPTLIAEAFEKSSAIARCYDLASAAIHGRILRGKELMSDRYGKQADSACLTGLNILEWACNNDEKRKYWFPATVILMNAQHAARQIGKLTPQEARTARQIMGVYEGNLKSGKDYTGDGTKASPILFRQHLFYYPTINYFLTQMDVDPGGRILDQSSDGRLCEIYAGSDRDWWFEIPSSCFDLLLNGTGGADRRES